MVAAGMLGRKSGRDGLELEAVPLDRQTDHRMEHAKSGIRASRRKKSRMRFAPSGLRLELGGDSAPYCGVLSAAR